MFPAHQKLKGFDTVIKLSSNEGALGPSPKATAAFKATGNELHRYPDGNALERKSIGDRHGLNPEKVICGAGSDEILALLARAYAGPGDEILFGEHAFVMYPIFALSVGATPVKAPENETLPSQLTHCLAKSRSARGLFMWQTPTIPTGTMLASDEMSRLRAGLREDILLVIDAAYAEYVIRDDYSPGIELVDAGENVVMTRTFSKIYAMGGARLGWAYCPEKVCEVINKIRPPFNVTSGAQAAGIAAVNDVEFMTRSRDHNTEYASMAF